MKNWTIRPNRHTPKEMFREGPAEVPQSSYHPQTATPPPNANKALANSPTAGLESVLSSLRLQLARTLERVESMMLDRVSPSLEIAKQLRQLEPELGTVLKCVRQALAYAEGNASVALSDLHAEKGTGSLRRSVLCVDDDPAARQALQELLDPHFAVTLAANGTEALEMIRRVPPDVVVADFCMPEFDGLSLVKAIHRQGDPDEVPCLILSGLADTEAKIRAFEAGAFDYLTKPINPDEFIARIRSVLSRSELLRRERHLQSTDDLTGLANRRRFRSFFEEALRSAHALHSDLTVVIADMDGLKQINDQYGHLIGDEAIRTLGKALVAPKRAADCAARIGGDEFVVIMPGTNHAGALRFIGRVDSELRNRPLSVGPGQSITVSASYGIAARNEGEGEEALEQILERADRELYRTKKGPAAS